MRGGWLLHFAALGFCITCTSKQLLVRVQLVQVISHGRLKWLGYLGNSPDDIPKAQPQEAGSMKSGLKKVRKALYREQLSLAMQAKHYV